MAAATIGFLTTLAVITRFCSCHQNDVGADNVLAYAIADDFGNVSIQPTDGGRFVGKAIYTRDTNTTGWNYLEIFTSRKEDDSMQAYAAGLLEGWITADAIHMYWYNMFRHFCDRRTDVCKTLHEYLRTNRNWVETQVTEKNGSDAYWYQVGLVYKQLDGLHDGYNANIKEGMQSLSWEHFFWMNIQEDLYDLYDAFNSTHPHRKPFGAGSGSVLIKLLPGYKELFFSHVTWNWYETMMRIQKRYRLNYKESISSNQLVYGHDISFSSYPGFLYSMDDFYLISSGLAVTQTTNTVYNSLLWANVRPIGQISVFVRSMVANRLASDGLAWTKYFQNHNSGTRNNQWLVVNYSLFRPGHQMPENGLLYILEQMPGIVKTQDVTKMLLDQMYWASYNVPFIPAVFKTSGQQDMMNRYGNWFSYHDTPRARLFARDQASVIDLQTMLQLMRSNDFRNDPESRCKHCIPRYSAENAVSSRADLNDRNGSYPFEALGYSNRGATDVKITSHRMFKSLIFVAISGPTSGTSSRLGPYCWSRASANVSHLGLPDCWDFEPETHKWVF